MKNSLFEQDGKQLRSVRWLSSPATGWKASIVSLEGMGWEKMVEERSQPAESLQ